MREVMTAYFEGERVGGALAAIIGFASIAFATGLLAPRWDLRPMAITMIVLGGLEMAIGLGLFFKSDPQLARLIAQLGTDSATYYAEEGARMARVQRTFVILEIAWLVLIAGGALTAVLAKSRPTFFGIALGVLLHASFFLAFDLVADRRGAVYFDALRQG